MPHESDPHAPRGRSAGGRRGRGADESTGAERTGSAAGGRAPGRAAPGRRASAAAARASAAGRRRDPHRERPHTVPASPARPADPRRRMLLVVAASLVLLLAVGGKLLAIQAMDTAQLAQRALASRLVTKTLPAARGVITSANGTVLADNAQRYRLVVDQRNVARYKDSAGTTVGAWGAAQALAGPLDTEAGLLYPKLNGDKLWNVVASGVTSEVWEKVRDLDIPGISQEEYAIRSYPAGALGGNLVGFVGSDGQPLGGLELQYEDSLKGTDGKEQYERGLSGDTIPLGANSTQQPVNGTGLQLSLDSDVQLYLQQAIAAAVKQRKAEWGTIVIEDVETGRIIGLADAPTVDPNNPGKTAANERGSRALTDVFEPGSTAKMITASALVQEGKVAPDTQFTVPYKWKAPNDEEFKDSHEHEDEKLTFAGILQQSSNTGTILAGQRLSPQQRYDYLHAFGFGASSGIGYPGATAGILHEPGSWDGRTAYTVMFGQGVAATAMQTTSAVATIAGGGTKMPQQLVSGTVDDSGRVTEIPPGQGTRVISEETSKKVVSMLESVVTDGTGKSAAIPGYRALGKTGTAQAPAADGKGYDGYTASFVGAAPAENPKIAVSVVLQRPRKGYYGGTAAAPVFSDVAGYTLRHLGVAPSTEKPDTPAGEWK